jgi:hypothetical protein
VINLFIKISTIYSSNHTKHTHTHTHITSHHSERTSCSVTTVVSSATYIALNSSVFWVTTQRRLACLRRFGTTYRSLLQGSSCPRRLTRKNSVQPRRKHTLPLTEQFFRYTNVSCSQLLTIFGILAVVFKLALGNFSALSADVTVFILRQTMDTKQRRCQ